MEPAALRDRVERFVRERGLIPDGAPVTCLVSGGPDSTCLLHVLRALGHDVSALHGAHGRRGSESDEDARFCREELGARVVEAPGAGKTEAELRELRYAVAVDGLRATGHTASDQVETVLFRLVSSATTKAIKPLREDGVARPLLEVWREETQGYCRAEGIAFRVDRSNADTKRGLIRDEVLPLLEQLHPSARENLLRLAEQRPPLTDELAELLASPAGSKRVDLGGGVQAVREYERVWLEDGPVPLTGSEVRWGDWSISAASPGLTVRGWRAGDRLAGRSKKVQDVFVDAKIPRSDRESWPLVVRGDEVVAIPGLVEHPDVRAERA
jgi:tRNA(Ile)-lysidine synthase